MEKKSIAIELRQQGKSLGEIAGTLGIPKGTVNYWTRNVALSVEQKSKLLSHPNAYKAPKKERGEQSKFSKSVTESKLSRQDKAKVAEAAVLFRLVLHGFGVFGSQFDGDKTDWLVETPKGTKRIQVKWARGTHKWGLPTISLSCKEGHSGVRRYREGEFDFIVGYDLFSDTAYVYSFEEVKENQTSVTVSNDAAERWDKLK